MAQPVELATATVDLGDARLRSPTRSTVPDELDDIPRVGVRLRLGPGVHAVEWLGDGPHEGYSDRRASTRVGRWTTAGRRLAGARTCTRRPAATAPACAGSASSTPTATSLLTIDELDDLDVTVSRWTDEEVADAGHLEDLPDRDECFVWIDAAHRGVGSGAVGPDTAPRPPRRPGHVPLVVPAPVTAAHG